MSSLVLALAITTAVCLLFSSTRLFGVIGLFVLIALFPVPSSIALALAGIFYFWRK